MNYAMLRSITLNDLRRRRREYLWLKANRYAKCAYMGGIGLLGLLTAVLFGVATLGNVQWQVHEFTHNGTIPSLGSLTVTAVIAALFGVVSRLAWLTAVHAAEMTRAVRALPRVPPVSVQIAALPADEVLVRAACRPQDAPAELLRTAISASPRTDGLLRPDPDSRMLPSHESS